MAQPKTNNETIITNLVIEVETLRAALKDLEARLVTLEAAQAPKATRQTAASKDETTYKVDANTSPWKSGIFATLHTALVELGSFRRENIAEVLGALRMAGKVTSKRDDKSLADDYFLQMKRFGMLTDAATDLAPVTDLNGEPAE